MNKPRPSRAGQLASIQTDPNTAADFRDEADRLSLDRSKFLGVLLRAWGRTPKARQNAAIRK